MIVLWGFISWGHKTHMTGNNTPVGLVSITQGTHLREWVDGYRRVFQDLWQSASGTTWLLTGTILYRFTQGVHYWWADGYCGVSHWPLTECLKEWRSHALDKKLNTLSSTCLLTPYFLNSKHCIYNINYYIHVFVYICVYNYISMYIYFECLIVNVRYTKWFLSLIMNISICLILSYSIPIISLF